MVNMMDSKDEEAVSYTKLFLIKSLSMLFSNSEYANKKVQTFVLQNQELNIIGEICELFIKTCQSGDLLQISYALDGFYEVFSENFYDEELKK